MNSKETRMKKLFSIYAIQCVPTGRVYIGSTSNFEQRIRAHFNELKNKKKMARIRVRQCEYEYQASDWQRDYDKHGESAFVVYLMEEGISSEDEAQKEAYYIEHYNATSPEFGYNKRAQAKCPPIQFVRGTPKKLNTCTKYLCPPETMSKFMIARLNSQ